MWCVQCNAENATETLFISYSPGNVRLKRCKECNNFMDKYVECQYLLLIMDLVLLKPQAFRHVLRNTTITQLRRLIFVNTILKAYLLLYLHLERTVDSTEAVLSFWPLLFFLTLSLAEQMAFLASFYLVAILQTDNNLSFVLVEKITFLSSFSFMLFIPMIIWNYPAVFVQVVEYVPVLYTYFSIISVLPSRKQTKSASTFILVGAPFCSSWIVRQLLMKLTKY